jgi:hypothetical protein
MGGQLGYLRGELKIVEEEKKVKECERQKLKEVNQSVTLNEVMDQAKKGESLWLPEHVRSRSGKAKNADVYMTNRSERWKIDVCDHLSIKQ